MSDFPWRHLADSNPYLESSSPDPTPSQPTQIFMISPPDSLDDSIDENLVFLTPPEHQRRMSSSSDDDLLLGFKKARVLEDEPRMKKIRVSGAELGGENQEGVVVEDSGQEMCAVNLAEDAPGKFNMDRVENVAPVEEAVEAERSKEKSTAEKCDISGSGIDESGQGQGRCVGEVEMVAGAGSGVDDGKIVSSDVKRSQDIDELVLSCKKLIGGTSNVAENACELVNKENGRGVSREGGVGREKVLREFLGALKVIVRSLNNTLGDSEVDFLETARKRGMTFPRPRCR